MSKYSAKNAEMQKNYGKMIIVLGAGAMNATRNGGIINMKFITKQDREKKARKNAYDRSWRLKRKLNAQKEAIIDTEIDTVIESHYHHHQDVI